MEAFFCYPGTMADKSALCLLIFFGTSLLELAAKRFTCMIWSLPINHGTSCLLMISLVSGVRTVHVRTRNHLTIVLIFVSIVFMHYLT